MSEMTWEQKFQACNALRGGILVTLQMRAPGDWYVGNQHAERKEGGVLSGGCVTGAKTPEEAVNQHWDWLTDPKYYLVIGAYGSERKAVRWNGFMWESVNEARDVAA